MPKHHDMIAIIVFSAAACGIGTVGALLGLLARRIPEINL
jgi:hypothetical protein